MVNHFKFKFKLAIFFFMFYSSVEAFESNDVTGDKDRKEGKGSIEDKTTDRQTTENIHVKATFSVFTPSQRLSETIKILSTTAFVTRSDKADVGPTVGPTFSSTILPSIKSTIISKSDGKDTTITASRKAVITSSTLITSRARTQRNSESGTISRTISSSVSDVINRTDDPRGSSKTNTLFQTTKLGDGPAIISTSSVASGYSSIAVFQARRSLSAASTDKLSSIKTAQLSSSSIVLRQVVSSANTHSTLPQVEGNITQSASTFSASKSLKSAFIMTQLLTKISAESSSKSAMDYPSIANRNITLLTSTVSRTPNLITAVSTSRINQGNNSNETSITSSVDSKTFTQRLSIKTSSSPSSSSQQEFLDSSTIVLPSMQNHVENTTQQLKIFSTTSLKTSSSYLDPGSNSGKSDSNSPLCTSFFTPRQYSTKGVSATETAIKFETATGSRQKIVASAKSGVPVGTPIYQTTKSEYKKLSTSRASIESTYSTVQELEKSKVSVSHFSSRTGQSLPKGSSVFIPVTTAMSSMTSSLLVSAAKTSLASTTRTAPSTNSPLYLSPSSVYDNVTKKASVVFSTPRTQSPTLVSHSTLRDSNITTVASKSTATSSSVLNTTVLELETSKIGVTTKASQSAQLNSSLPVILQTSPISSSKFSNKPIPATSSTVQPSNSQSKTLFASANVSLTPLLSTSLAETKSKAWSLMVSSALHTARSPVVSLMHSTSHTNSYKRQLESGTTLVLMLPSSYGIEHRSIHSSVSSSFVQLVSRSEQTQFSQATNARKMSSMSSISSYNSATTSTAVRALATQVLATSKTSVMSPIATRATTATFISTATTTGRAIRKTEVPQTTVIAKTTTGTTESRPSTTTITTPTASTTATTMTTAATTKLTTPKERPVTEPRTTSKPIHIGEPKLHTELIAKFKTALNVEFHVSFPGILEAYKLQIVAQKYDHRTFADNGKRLRTWYEVHYFEDYKHESYIVIEFNKKHTVQRSKFNFTIGSDVQCENQQVRFRYCNGPLHKGAYRFRLFYHVHGTVKKSGFSKVYTTAAAATTPQDENDGLNPSNITIAVIAVLAVLLFLIFIIAVILCRRKSSTRNENYGDTEVSECTLLTSLKRTSSCSKSCYGRGAMATGDSSLMLKSLTKGMSRPVHVKDFVAWVTRSQADSDFRFAEEFESVRDVGRDQSHEASDVPENRGKNRYVNVLAYDRTRVKLSYTDDEIGSDYINANYIHGYKHPRSYIATQGPLPGTTDDFWRMIWEQNTYVIVMATQCVERNRVKCHQYWPGAQATAYGDIIVSLLSEVAHPEWVEREFLLEVEDDGNRRIHHFQYTSWPDHGVPKNAASALEFIHTVRSHVVPCQGPIVIHCSAGVGRTGTLIAIDSMFDRLQDEDTIDIYLCICLMRMQRCNMVQTEEQYIFIHRVLVEYLKSINKSSIFRGYSLLSKEEDDIELESDDCPSVNRDSGLALLLSEYDTQQVEEALESVA